MKKTARLFAISTLAIMLVTTLAAAGPKGKTWTGWISDSNCAAKGMEASHKDCAATCVKEKGAKWVFVDSETKQVHAIHNQDAVKEENLGMEVKLTGDVMKDKSLHVEKIEPAS